MKALSGIKVAANIAANGTAIMRNKFMGPRYAGCSLVSMVPQAHARYQ